MYVCINSILFTCVTQQYTLYRNFYPILSELDISVTEILYCHINNLLDNTTYNTDL